MVQHYFVDRRHSADRFRTTTTTRWCWTAHAMSSVRARRRSRSNRREHDELSDAPVLHRPETAGPAGGCGTRAGAHGRLRLADVHLAEPLFWLLDKIHMVTGNWGWAIIFLTMLIKLAFFKLSETSYRSMANMRKIQPRLKTLQERYKDDRQRLQQAMMEMYKKEKINPLGGCLPILVQIPVFIALYWVLLESVELRQAPWASLDPGPVQPRPVLRPARADGCQHVPAAEAEPGAAGPGAAEGDDGVADRVHGVLRVLPVGTGALLVREQPDLACRSRRTSRARSKPASNKKSPSRRRRDAEKRKRISLAKDAKTAKKDTKGFCAKPRRPRRAPRKKFNIEPGRAAA
jgi:YidC/Oxa1 family membrane protein insertase